MSAVDIPDEVLAQMADSDDVRTRARGVITQVLTEHGVPVPYPLAVAIIRALADADLQTFDGGALKAHIERVAERAREKGRRSSRCEHCFPVTR